MSGLFEGEPKGNMRVAFLGSFGAVFLARDLETKPVSAH